MPVSFTDAFDVNKELFDSTDAFDPILDVDSKLFIDPALLPISSCPEFLGSKNEIEKFFSEIIALVRGSKTQGDRFWKAADKKLKFKEIKGTCLGYSESGIAGNAIGARYRNRILEALHELDEAGTADPIIFELIGVFEDGIGCDRISDLITYKLIGRICCFTTRIMKECAFGGPVTECNGFKLPFSPYSESPVLLLPKDILHPLPLAKRFEDLEAVCRENERVRNSVNRWFDFSGGRTPTKREMYDHFRDDPEFRAAYVEAYKEADACRYDFFADSEGETTWYEQGKRFAHLHPLTIARKPSSLENETCLESVVVAIVEHFKSLVENNGAWELLFKEDRQTPRKERSSQHLFAAIASSYCRANNIDINPEVNSGNGPVDFKFSSGYENRVLVELKLSRNPKLCHCIDKQIPIYMAQEDTDKAIYLLINTGNDERVKSFCDKYHLLPAETKRKIPLVVVDAKPKASASTA